MNGTQKDVYQIVMEFGSKIMEGFYGEDDDFDLNSLQDDIADELNIFASPVNY